MLVLRKNKTKSVDKKFSENREKFAQLNKAFNNFSRHLKPFHFKREFLANILELNAVVTAAREEALEEKRKPAFYYCRDVLEELNPSTEWAKHKSELIRRHFSLMKAIRGEIDYSWAKHSGRMNRSFS